MKIYVKAKPKAREEKIEKIDETHFVIWVKEPPEKGKANKALLKLLAKYFKVSQNSVRMISGKSSKMKVAEVIVSG